MGAYFSHSPASSQNTHTMEESQPLSTNDSFSSNWLMSMRNPVKSVNFPKNTLGFFLNLEGDHSRSSLKSVDRSSFHFDIPGLEPTDMSVADQMIRNGSLVPLNLINERNNEIENNAIPEDSMLFPSPPTDSPELFRIRYCHVDPKHPITRLHYSPISSPASISNNGIVLRDARRKLRSFERSKKPPKRILILNYFKSLLHFCKKVNEFGMSEVRPVSPKPNDDALCRTQSGCSSPLYDVGREGAIREAILYCKSSSRKYMEGFEVDQDEGSHK